MCPEEMTRRQWAGNAVQRKNQGMQRNSGQTDNTVDLRKWRGLFKASYEGDLNTASQILNDSKVDLEEVDEEGWTVVLQTAWYGHTHLIELFLNNGAQVNTQDYLGKTPLHWAAQFGYEASVNLLLARGALVNVQSKSGTTALHETCSSGYVGVVKILLDHGADVNLVDVQGKSVGHVVAERGRDGIDDQIMKLLIERNLDPNIGDEDGQTALHSACATGNEVMVRDLLNAGANASARTLDGMEPVMFVAQCPNPWGVVGANILLSHGANVNSVSEEGRTALHEAAEAGYPEVVGNLLRHGADKTILDENGETALDLALSDQVKSVLLG